LNWYNEQVKEFEKAMLMGEEKDIELIFQIIVLM